MTTDDLTRVPVVARHFEVQARKWRNWALVYKTGNEARARECVSDVRGNPGRYTSVRLVRVLELYE